MEHTFYCSSLCFMNCTKITKPKNKKAERNFGYLRGYPQLRYFSAIITIFNTMIHIFNHPEEYLINDYEILGLSFF
jgi:hypothetical protein